MKTVAIIQARLGSRRLPKKVLMDIAGRPMIEHVIERAQAIQGVDQVVLNVPAQDAAAFLPKTYCTVYGVPNQEQDVLASYLYVAEREQADVIMRLTGDCWSLCPEISAQVLGLFLAGGCDYAANIQPFTTWPDGLDTEVFSMDILRSAVECAETALEREHVTAWVRENGRCVYLPCPDDCSKICLSVNEQKDLDQARRLMLQLQPSWTYRDLLEALRKENIWDGQKIQNV